MLRKNYKPNESHQKGSVEAWSYRELLKISLRVEVIISLKFEPHCFKQEERVDINSSAVFKQSRVECMTLLRGLSVSHINLLKPSRFIVMKFEKPRT